LDALVIVIGVGTALVLRIVLVVIGLIIIIFLALMTLVAIIIMAVMGMSGHDGLIGGNYNMGTRELASEAEGKAMKRHVWRMGFRNACPST
jgi:predicted tellurium resistance membrane protein TerC